ncbi:hypothetical protein ACTXT7_012818 [Hymenolepis weldensis]
MSRIDLQGFRPSCHALFSQTRVRSPPLRQVPPPPQSQRSRRSRSRSNEESEDRSTYANVSWSQSRGRQAAPKAPPPVPSQLDRNPVRSGLDSPPRKRHVIESATFDLMDEYVNRCVACAHDVYYYHGNA